MHRRAAGFIVAGVLALSPLVYAGMLAGDAVIHLVYARNAALGHFFEFNPGETAAGVTSPGYMLLIAPLFMLLPEEQVPLMVKLLNLLSWYSALILFYALARRLLGSRSWALVGLAVAGTLPGSVYNANVGMENGIFAAVVLGWMYLADRWRWWSGVRVGGSREAVLGTLLGLACWLRPEGMVVAALMLMLRVRAAEGTWAQRLLATARMTLPFVLALFVLIAGLLAFHRSQTGYGVPSSAMARVLDGYRQSAFVGLLPVSLRVAERLVLYLPLTIAWLVGCWLVMRGIGRRHTLETMRAAAVTSVLFLALYSTVLGAAQLARYTIFVMMLVTLLAAMGAQHMWARFPVRAMRIAPRWAVFACAGMALVVVFAVETRARLALGSHDALAEAREAPRLRARISEQFFNDLGRPQGRPIVVAFVEVQIRYWLDDRFVVRSLDGRVDERLLKHAYRDRVDHVGYIKDRGIQYVAEFPNYNRDPQAWALDRLLTLSSGESTVHEGLRFTRLPLDLVRVEPAASPDVQAP